MLKILNSNVYGLEESLIASGYPMVSTSISEIQYDENRKAIAPEEAYKRAMKLGNVPSGSGHDNFLKGILVQFDVTYPQYWTPQFQRYHFADIVSSQSKMHRLTKMDIKKSCNKYVSEEIINHLNKFISDYNQAVANKDSKDNLYEKFMKVISNTPMGFEMTMRVTSNYLQLKTIYLQRKHHKLKEDWSEFCNWAETLPYFNEFCLKKI